MTPLDPFRELRFDATRQVVGEDLVVAGEQSVECDFGDEPRIDLLVGGM